MLPSGGEWFSHVVYRFVIIMFKDDIHTALLLSTVSKQNVPMF